MGFVRSGGVGSKRPGPFVAGVACCAASLNYGLASGRPPVWSVNAVGLTLHLGYVACYATWAGHPRRRGVLRAMAVLALAFAAFLYYAHQLQEGDGQEQRIRTCSFLNCC